MRGDIGKRASAKIRIRLVVLLGGIVDVVVQIRLYGCFLVRGTAKVIGETAGAGDPGDFRTDGLGAADGGDVRTGAGELGGELGGVEAVVGEADCADAGGLIRPR